MRKCDFNKFAAYFRNTFSKEHLWTAAFEQTNFFVLLFLSRKTIGRLMTTCLHLRIKILHSYAWEVSEMFNITSKYF